MSNKNLSLHQAKDTGMALVLVCIILFLFSQQRLWIIAALVFLLICMISPKLYQPAAVVWFKLSNYLGGFASTLLLTIIFYVVVTPIALIRQLTGADALKLKQWRKSKSAFTERNITFSATDLEKPY